MLQEEIEINGKKILRKKIGKKGKKPPVACEICGTISKGAFNNARHLYTMHGIKREVQCDKCDTLCESVRAMLEHKKNHHSSASCHLCGKVRYTYFCFSQSTIFIRYCFLRFLSKKVIWKTI